MAGTQLPGWPREVLLERANAWSRTHGWSAITEAALLGWRREDLIPAPRFHSLGRGRGSVQLWPTLAYRRMLQVSRLRSRGLTHHRDQRLHLWLLGNPADPAAVRTDLLSFYTSIIRQTNAALRTEQWAVRPTERRVRGLARQVTEAAPSDLASAVVQWDGRAAPLLTLVHQWIQSPEATRLIGTLIYDLYAPNGTGLQQMIQHVRNTLPESLRLLIPEELASVIATVAGVLARPETFENPLLEALSTCPDQLIIDVHDAIRGWNDIVAGTLTLAARVIARNPSRALGVLTPWAAPITGLLETLARHRALRTPGDGLALFPWLLVLGAGSTFDVGRLAAFARSRGGSRLFHWLALHLDELEQAAAVTPGDLAALVTVLPPDRRDLWELAFPSVTGAALP